MRRRRWPESRLRVMERRRGNSRGRMWEPRERVAIVEISWIESALFICCKFRGM